MDVLNDAAEITLTGGRRVLEAGVLFPPCLSAKTLISYPVRSSSASRDGVSLTFQKTNCSSSSSVLAGDGKAGKSQGCCDAGGRGTALAMEQDGST